MHVLNFPGLFVKWIMTCITITSYNINLNRGCYGSIKGKRGLRQGDLISLLLFVICMEYFTRIMGHVAKKKEFNYHTKCKGVKLTHLYFADDMILFSKGEYTSVMLMLRGLKSFSNVSGMTVNANKSNIFCANMNGREIEDTCEVTWYKKDKLPF